MARTTKRGQLATCVLSCGDVQCDECGFMLGAGDSLYYDPRNDASTCSVICAETMRARGDVRPSPFHF